MTTCVKCGNLFEREPGPGRPAAYCGATCRRLVEFEIRRLDRRIAAYELEQRALKYDGPGDDEWNERERQRRMRALRKWLAADEARLRELVAAGQGNQTIDAGSDS
ncbi:MAG: hypothetical protein IT503_14370 [Burkholderiaceae bacterium]|nr:MAG: hypothetical protein F9K36_18120 [Burkholderiaceae bacterium]MCC7287359.1 hypothetical protein [Burkholderiaceae bacterium]